MYKSHVSRFTLFEIALDFFCGIQSQMMASVPMVAILYFCHEILHCTRLVLHRHHALKVPEVWDQHHLVVKCNKNTYNFVCLSILMVLSESFDIPTQSHGSL